MGSRAIAVVARDKATAETRFRMDDGTTGALYTRTGRSFFKDATRTDAVLTRLRDAIGKAGLWDELNTDWLVLDCELLPWSAKAMELIRTQYAATAAAARAALPVASRVLAQAHARGLDIGDLRERTEHRTANAARFRDAFARYCWDVDGIGDLRIAPFQLLAAEGETLATTRDNEWHMAMADRLAAADAVDAPGGVGLIRSTATRVVDLADPASEADATSWWEKLTADGGEGMVVKPLGPLPAERKVQPGLKVRGREYLRIIYGPDYTDHLDRLRGRSMGRKRSLAMREHALGLAALDRLTAGEPLWRVHQAVFAVLALESEPVDPRL